MAKDNSTMSGLLDSVGTALDTLGRDDNGGEFIVIQFPRGRCIDEQCGKALTLHRAGSGNERRQGRELVVATDLGMRRAFEIVKECECGRTYHHNYWDHRGMR